MVVLNDRCRLRRVLCRAGMCASALWLIALTAGVALHLYGRACFSRATANLETILGKEIHFDFSHLENSPPPKEENAAQRLLEGAEALQLSDSEERRIREAWHLARDEWSPELEQGVRALIDRHRAGLESLHGVAALDESSFGIQFRDGYYRGGRTVGTPVGVIGVARLLNVAGRMALADGDLEGGLAAASALARIATVLQQEPLPVYLLLAVSVERSLNRMVFEILETSGPLNVNAGFFAELEARLPTWDWQKRAQEILLINGLMWSVDVREERQLRDKVFLVTLPPPG